MARPRSPVMVGRDAELSVLQAAAERARRGEVGLVLVTGEAGIGKSRLVAELAARLADARVPVSHGVAMSTGEIPFGVLAELLASLLRAEPDVLTGPERDALAPLLPGTSRTGDRTAMLSAALDVVERLSRDRLLVWVVEDLQWADAASLDLLGVALRTAHGRLLVVATVRTDAAGRGVQEDPVTAELARLPGAETLRLAALAPADVRRQVAALGLPLDAATRARIEELSGGVPFDVEELAATGAAAHAGGRVLVSRRRVEGLGPDAARLVEAAAVGAGHLRLDLLEQVTDLAGEELDQALKEASEAGVLEERPSHDEVAFRHPLLREAADDAIGPAARRAWHRRWAQVLEANAGVVAASPAAIATAQHWARSGDAARTLDASVRAAFAAGELDLHEVEAEMWERVLGLWDGVAALPDLGPYDVREIRRFWRWAVGQVDADRYLSLVKDDVRAATDPSTRACLELSLLVHEGTSLDTAADPAALDGLERRARSGPRDLVLAVFLNNLAEVVLNDGDRDRAHALVQESAEIFDERGDSREAVRARSFLALFDVLDGQVERGVAQLDALLAEGHDRVYVRRWVGNVLMVAHAVAGDAKAADAAFEMVAATLDTRLDWPTYELQLHVIMRTWIDTGRWAHALEVYDELAPNWAGRTVPSDLHAARLELLRDGAVADPAFWTALPERDAGPGGVDPVSARLLAAQVHGVGGDLTRMRQLLAPVWAETHPRYSDHALLGYLWTAVRDVVRIEVDAAAGARDAGDRAGAQAHLATVTAFAARMHREGRLGAAWTAELDAQLARFRGDAEQVSLFAAAADRWRDVGHRHDAGTCELYLAQALAARGDRDAARDHAGAALEVARALGAAPLARRAGALLQRLGLRGHADGSLTRRELDVLELVATGRTNRQIAAALAISPKTAGIHVSRIIAKLGAANRTEAAAVGRRTGLL